MSSLTPTSTILKMLDILENLYPTWKAPIVTFIAVSRGTPYQVLIATLLSLRTKDQTTEVATRRLFASAKTPQEMLTLSEDKIRNLIYPVGFYKVKSKRIKEVSALILEKFNGKVPNTMEELLSLPGVGRKTANLVLSLGYNIPSMCVDVHVHRISNRWNYVNTKTPEQTEFALRDSLPVSRWIRYNDVLVAFGQIICRPVSPHCSECPISNPCPRQGVEKSR